MRRLIPLLILVALVAPRPRLHAAEAEGWKYYWRDIAGLCAESCPDLVYKCPCMKYTLDLPK